ncbi:MAG: UDP-N-acetylmuramate dehydrogenase [Elusimicrobia bacterium]|nr:UDP-N-acetylmuramate dehydrogenase [Elusimicrobiota bacterium]
MTELSDACRAELEKILPQARFDESLGPHTTFRVGGPADCYAEVMSRRELSGLLEICRRRALPFMLLGWGSNVLVKDKGVRGVVARLRGDFERIEFLEGRRVLSGAGVRVPQLVSLCAERGLSGPEPLVGVPGTVGGALVMNAGTRDGEIARLVAQIETIDPGTLEFRWAPASEFSFSYRRTSLEGRVVLGCLLQLKAGDKGDIIRRIQRHQQKRLQTQPIHTYNVGSTFKNPPGRYVAELIERAGLKGKAFGGARISPMHANFIENFSHATASDILELVRLAGEKVKSETGIDLELEMKVVGE